MYLCTTRNTLILYATHLVYTTPHTQTLPGTLTSAQHHNEANHFVSPPGRSPDGSLLALTSVDGYVTFFAFDADELGEAIAPEEGRQILEAQP